ncbi:MAG TPA: nicotinate (nicotinamide) nucleotide adenylyltransferase [Silvibacterium sp.]|nr:nicotinate (nicotinamide) nucleotide adenylyltransferase [Silvibacterium sp.]
MRVALFGGTFDPPHRGHVALVRLARERLSLDRILVAPVAAQPLKQDASSASFADRLAMTRLAFAGERAAEISLLDAPRSDKASNYTIDTLATLQRQLSPGDALYCILGADSFLTIAKWHRSAELLTTCDFIVGARPGFDLGCAEAALPDGVSAKPLHSALHNTQLLELTGERGKKTRLYLLTDLAEHASATQVRAALRGETGTERLLSPAVEQYIRAHHLYTASIE